MLSNLNLDVRLWLRRHVAAASFRLLGLAFLFAISISTISFAGSPPGKNNDASGLTNLARTYRRQSVGTAFSGDGAGSAGAVSSAATG